MSSTDPSAKQPEVQNSPLGVGIVGLGFMGQTHLAAYQNAIADGLHATVLAVADGDPDRRAGIPTAAGNIGESQTERLFDPDAVKGYADAADLFSDERVGLVSICTPTDTHVSLALKSFESGKHVLLEKPVALDAGEVETLAAAAKSAGVICIPAMCMRFWPAWAWLKQAIDASKYGPVRAARFERLGSTPAWGQAFYNDLSRSGGALFDFHIHDADFVTHCFGVPESVTARGRHNHVCTSYHFEGGPASVHAEAGWLNSPHFPFRMRYTVEFENAVADFDLLRDQPLRVHTAGGTEEPELSAHTGYDLEIRHAIESVIAGTQPSPSLDDAALVTRVLQAEAQSLESGAPVRL